MFEIRWSVTVHGMLAVILVGFLASSCTGLTTATPKGAEAFEKVPEGEDQGINEITVITPQLQATRKEAFPVEQDDKVLRGVHPKSHGCVDATFTINPDIAKKYQVGLFADPGKEYSAKIRFSNASVRRDPDVKKGRPPQKFTHGSRGMAIKVLEVEGDFLIEDNTKKNQDFLMINTPEFAFPDVRSYRFLTRALKASPKADSPDGFVGIAFVYAGVQAEKRLKKAEISNPTPEQIGPKPEDFRVTEAAFIGFKNGPKGAMLPEDFSLQDMNDLMASLGIIGVINRTTVRNSLEIQYFGAATFLFGEQEAMKFSAKPRKEPEQKPFTPADDILSKDNNNYLRKALTKTMKGNETIFYDFQIQTKGKHEDFGTDQKLIENASTTWENERAAYVSVAEIRIEAPQQTDTKKSRDECEELAFTPWHSLKAHQPIGGINRLRKNVYQSSAGFRKAANHNSTTPEK